MAAMAKQAFVCYARKDEQFVLPLAANLQKRGCSVWVDKWDIPPGANWDRTVDGALRSCRVFLFVMSPNAVNSSEVEGELRTALDLHKSIVPVFYRRCEIPRQLRTTQYVDFSHGNPNHEASLQQLVETLKHWNTVLLGHPPIPDSTPRRPPSGARAETRAPAYQQSPRNRALDLEPWQYAVLLVGVGLLLAILMYFGYFYPAVKGGFPLHSQAPLGPTMAAAETPHCSDATAENLVEEARPTPGPVFGRPTTETEVDHSRAALSDATAFRSVQGKT